MLSLNYLKTLRRFFYGKNARSSSNGVHDRRIRFMVIKETKISLTLQKKCEILNINKSSYYKWLKATYVTDDTIDKLIVDIFNKHK